MDDTVVSNLISRFSEQGVLSVSELTQHIKHLLQEDRELQDIWIRGEISNLTNHRSGHIYFTLKDSRSQIQCVMFKWYAKRLRFKPETGMKALVFGSVNIYEARSQYQLQVAALRPDGIGELYKAFEQLKIKLASEGLFDEAHKKLLPRYPEKIGIVSSPTGAVIHDIINITRRRYPVHLILAPTQVQGVEAAESIITSIRALNRLGVDVIILARGGGSIEDLWAFNEEPVARAIFNSTVPVVSAIGHETDYTIADFTADLRAPTPSAAAELVVPDLSEIQQQLTRHATVLSHAITRRLGELDQRVTRCESAVTLSGLYELLETKRNRVESLQRNLHRLIQHSLDLRNTRFTGTLSHLNAVSPLNTLERGYSITLRGQQVISSIAQVEEGDRLEVLLKDGTVESTVTGKNNRRRWEND